jgi:hypothetical protein
MEILSNVKKTDILPEFQTFLLDKKMCRKRMCFCALWVSKFLNYARTHQLSSDEYQGNAVSVFPTMTNTALRVSS